MRPAGVRRPLAEGTAPPQRTRACLNSPRWRRFGAAWSRPWSARASRDVLQRRGDLRFPFPDRFAARLRGRTVEALSRRAKYLLADLSGGDVLVMHLGMTGGSRWRRLLLEGAKAGQGRRLLPPRAWRPRAARPRRVQPRATAHHHLQRCPPLRLHDAREPGELGRASAVEGLGHRAARQRLDGALWRASSAARRPPLKAALLDQRLVAGLGNIYVCEALLRARLSPLRRASTLATPRPPQSVRSCWPASVRETC